MIRKRRFGAPRASAATVAAAAGSSCSRLSSRSSVVRSRRCSRRTVPIGWFGDSRRPIAPAIGRLEQARIAHRLEVDEPRAVWEAFAHTGRDREREPRLAAAARAGQRQDPPVGQLAAQPPDLVVAADQLGDVARQVRGRLERAQGPVVIRGPGDDQPMETERILEILHRAKPLVDEGQVLEAIVAVQARRSECIEQPIRKRLRQDDLAAVARRGDARRVVHVDADVVLGFALRAPTADPALAGVQAHSDAHDAAPSAQGSPPRPLRGDGGNDGGERPSEGREERVALGLDDDAALSLDRGT